MIIYDKYRSILYIIYTPDKSYRSKIIADLPYFSPTPGLHLPIYLRPSPSRGDHPGLGVALEGPDRGAADPHVVRQHLGLAAQLGDVLVGREEGKGVVRLIY